MYHKPWVTQTESCPLQSTKNKCVVLSGDWAGRHGKAGGLSRSVSAQLDSKTIDDIRLALNQNQPLGDSRLVAFPSQASSLTAALL